jgi:uncharacterized protein YndB with AHSA1/START domain
MPVDDLRLTHVPTVKVGMLIRRPARDVFRAFVDPDVTTRFWFTHSSGPLTRGAKVRWEWEMYGVSTDVAVRELEDDRRVVFDWGDAEESTTVKLRLLPNGDDATYVQVTETGFIGDGDAIVARVVGSTAGFYQVICAVKALLEHDVVLTVVRDHAPPERLDV